MPADSLAQGKRFFSRGYLGQSLPGGNNRAREGQRCDHRYCLPRLMDDRALRPTPQSVAAPVTNADSSRHWKALPGTDAGDSGEIPGRRATRRGVWMRKRVCQ